MINCQVLSRIQRAIDDLAEEYRRTPGLVLTEDDLKCQLFHRLIKLPELQGSYESADPGTFASMVHTEVAWFDETGKLRLRPDITITEPRLLSIHRTMQQGLRFPYKGFHFTGNSILLEI